MKVCFKCKVLKPASEYYKGYGGRNGSTDNRDYYCRYCRIGANLRSHRNKERKCTLENCNNSHYAKDLCRTHYARVIRNNTTERLTDIRKSPMKYLSRYGLTIEDYEEMAALGCGLCGIKLQPDGRPLQVDHSHEWATFPVPKEYVRGLTCHRCNVTLGKFDRGVLRDDNPLKEAILVYINRWQMVRYEKGN